MWMPQPRQVLFLQSPAYEVGYGGAKGGGKTDAILADATRQVDHPKYKAMIFRRTFKNLQEIIDRSHRWFQGFADWTGDKHRWTFKTGATISFSHCENEKDKYNHQGQEYHFLGFDQLEEFSESIYEFLIAQNRTNDPSIICRVRSTFNPGNVGHQWVKARFVDKLKADGQIKFFRKIKDIDTEVSKDTPGALSRAFVFASIHDNPKLLDADPNYLNRLENLPEALRRALLEGDWDAFEGQYFTEWSREKHIIAYRVFNELSREIPVSRFIASDYGFAKPSSTGWYAVFPDGQIKRYRELYRHGMTYEQLADEVLRMTPEKETIDYWTVDPATQGDKQHHKEPKEGVAKGKSGYEILCEKTSERFPVVLADNRRVIGWTRVREYFKTYKDQWGNETAMFQCTDNCQNLIRTIPTMIFDTTNPEDCNSDVEDHAADELRYAIMSRQNIPKDRSAPVSPVDKFWERVKKDLKNRGNIDGQEEEVDIDLSSEQIISD